MKNNYHLIWSALFFFLLSTPAFSQYPYPDKDLCEELKKRTLVVELLDETDETKTILNNALKEEFGAWDICPVVFKTSEEVSAILDARDTQFALLTQDNAVQRNIRTRKLDEKGRLMHGPGLPSNEQDYVAFTFSYYSFELLLPTGKKDPENITTIGFANGELSRIDYLYLVQQLNRLLSSSLSGSASSEYYDAEQGVAKISASKLIFLKDFFKEKEVAEIPKFLEVEFELLDMDEYQQVILGRESGKSYAKIIWSNQANIYVWVVVNAEDGEILGQQGFGGVKFGKTHDANDIIKVKHLKYVTNVNAQKFNSKY